MPPEAKRLFTAETRPRFSSGTSSCTEVWRTTTLMLSMAPQTATVLEPPADFTPPLLALYREKLGAGLAWARLERWTSYDKIASPRTTLMIASGEQRRFANLLLEVGLVKLAAENF